MKKAARKTTKKEEQSIPTLTTMEGVRELVRQGLREFVMQSGMLTLQAVLEEERTAVCGPRYAHDAERRATRGGHTDGALVLGGRRVTVRRPRARTRDGKEAVLPSWAEFSREDPLSERAVEQMVVGVATRKYARSLEPIAGVRRERGTSKSAVSRRFVSRTTERMDELLKRDLSALDLVVLMIDGIHFADHVMLVALGIDADGRKHVLGLHEGATENATACTALLADLRDRGMRTDRSMLVVIDGGKALRKAVIAVLGARAMIQRCQVHKLRNVEEHLPDHAAENAKTTMRKAYRARDVDLARRLLRGLAGQLRKSHPSAATSIEEGLEETLTVMKLGLPPALERTLCTTNPIENLMGGARNFSGRVKRWRGGEMIERWTSLALMEAEKKFRRLKGHVGMSKLIHALRALDEKIASGLASATKAA